jgi:hypothetical protein
MDTKTALLILLVATGSLTSLKVAGSNTPLTNNTISTINTDGPRKPGNNKKPNRIRSGVFTVNVLHFNQKIREKHDKELKALAMASNKKSAKERRADRKSKRLALQTIGI